MVSLKGEGVARGFLQGEGILPGAVVTVLALGGDGSVLLEIEGRHTHLAAAIADAVLVMVQE